MSTTYRIGRLLAAGILLILALPGGARASQPAAPLACEDGAQASGATYRICLPTDWDGARLVVYAHGYVSPTRPVGIPEDQMTLPGSGITVDSLVTAQGDAFAASGYSTNGLAIQEGIADLLDVVEIFKALHGEPQTVLLAGISEGGAIAALAAERHADVFDGVLALCSPYGDFARQVDTLGDFRILFDYYFPGVIPGSPIEVPSELLETWETSTYSETVRPLIVDPLNAEKVEELLTVAGAAYDPADLATQEQTVERLLWYNIYATGDAHTKLGGQPFDNATHSYRGSSDDAALNTGVARFTADPAARAAIAVDYETTGVLTVPLVTLHTTGDPVVPYWQAVAYSAKTIAADNIALHHHTRVDRYGHCQFTALELLGAFSTLVDLVENPPAYVPPTHVYLPVVDD